MAPNPPIERPPVLFSQELAPGTEIENRCIARARENRIHAFPKPQVSYREKERAKRRRLQIPTRQI